MFILIRILNVFKLQRYKVDSQFVYYIKAELENNRPLLRESIMEQGKVIRQFIPVSGDLQVGAILNFNMSW
ncbi:hypothetical protein [Lysinibacillus sp. VIII_CA]|uniref:hypothetical protein n=1 Tax=Lysinibacillus sp. VIII_CA TaxID=3417452 RepID=UPI003CE7DB80|nr:hypothetical protein OL548_20160 [Lysinibacillus sp. MHQ-1]